MTSASHVRRLASIAFSIGCLARLVPEQQLDVNQSAKYPAATFADGNLLGPPGLFGSTVTKSASSGDTVTLYATGCGPTDPPIPSGQIFTGHHTLSIKFPLRLEELPPAYFSPA